jgi:hypothetical protein
VQIKRGRAREPQAADGEAAPALAAPAPPVGTVDSILDSATKVGCRHASLLAEL